ncbi:MAG: zinc-ribbon domain-containing protein [Oscillospiraceae bacterium]|nr:zinc-ribbon domain-containing protein [Oscillospiraceae bacterium]
MSSDQHKSYCTNCSAELSEGASFCTSCGFAVNNINVQPQEQQYTQPQQPVYQQPTQEQLYTQSQQPVYQQPTQEQHYIQPQHPVYQQPTHEQQYTQPLQPEYQQQYPHPYYPHHTMQPKKTKKTMKIVLGITIPFVLICIALILVQVFLLKDDDDDPGPPTINTPSPTPTDLSTPSPTPNNNGVVDSQEMTFELFLRTINKIPQVFDELTQAVDIDDFRNLGMVFVNNSGIDMFPMDVFHGENILGMQGWEINSVVGQDSRSDALSFVVDLNDEFTIEQIISAFNVTEQLLFGYGDTRTIWVYRYPEDDETFEYSDEVAMLLLLSDDNVHISTWKYIDGVGSYAVYIVYMEDSLMFYVSLYSDDISGYFDDDTPEAWNMMEGIHNSFWMTLQEMVDYGYLLNPQHVLDGTWDWQYKGINYYQINRDLGYQNTYIGYVIHDDPNEVYPMVMYFGLNDLFGIFFMQYEEILDTFGSDNLFWLYSEYYGMNILYGETDFPYLYARFYEIMDGEFTAVYFSYYPPDFWE